MRKRSLILIAALMLAAAVFSACTHGYDNSADRDGSISTPENTEAVTVTGEKQEFPEESPFGEPVVEETEELNGRINESGLLKILTSSGPVIPYEYDPVGEILYGDGSIKEEGLPLSAFLPRIYEELPAADRSFGFDLDIYEWGMAYLIDVFASDSEMLAHGIGTAELIRFAREHNEELIVDVHIVVTGCVEDEWPEERRSKGYAFILSATDPDAEVSAASFDRPFLRLYSSGEEVETREFFMYGASAHYDENGVPVGMLCADGEAFFDPDHIARAYEELPVYTGCRVEGLDIRLSKGAEIKQIYVYDTADGFKMVSVEDMAALDRLIADSGQTEYVVEMVVYMRGNYIEELGEYEYEANGYAFIVK